MSLHWTIVLTLVMVGGYVLILTYLLVDRPLTYSTSTSPSPSPSPAPSPSAEPVTVAVTVSVPDPGTEPSKALPDDILYFSAENGGGMFTNRSTGGFLPNVLTAAYSTAVGTMYDVGSAALVWGQRNTPGNTPTLETKAFGDYIVFPSTSVPMELPNSETMASIATDVENFQWSLQAKVFFQAAAMGSSSVIITSNRLGNSATTGFSLRKNNTNQIQLFVNKGSSGNAVISTTHSFVVSSETEVNISISTSGVGSGTGAITVNGATENFDIATGTTADSDFPIQIGGQLNDGESLGISELIFRIRELTAQDIADFELKTVVTDFYRCPPRLRWKFDLSEQKNLFSDDLRTTVIAGDGSTVEAMNSSNPDASGKLQRHADSTGTNAITWDNLALTYLGIETTNAQMMTFSQDLISELTGAQVVFVKATNLDSAAGSHVFTGGSYVALTGEDYVGAFSDPYAVFHAADGTPDAVLATTKTNITEEVFAIRRIGSTMNIINQNMAQETKEVTSAFTIAGMGNSGGGIPVAWNMHGSIFQMAVYQGRMTDDEIRFVINQMKEV